MKIKITLLAGLFILIATSSSLAQNQCTDNLKKLISLIENNYPGFEQKTKDKTAYAYFKNGLITQAAEADTKTCFALQQQYISYFRDGHIFFLGASSYLKTEKTPAIENFKAGNNILSRIRKSSDEMEGIWKNEQFKIAILKKGAYYKGVVLASTNPEWKPGNVLFNTGEKNTADYYESDLTTYKDEFELKDSQTLFFTKLRTYFVKDNQDSIKPDHLRERISNLLGFSFQQLSQQTVMLRLKSFDYPFVDRINTLIRDHEQALQNASNLIIDLRDNGGGTTNAMKALLPYVMDGKTRSMNAEYWISDFFISGTENYLKGLVHNDKNQQEIKKTSRLLDFYKQNKGKYVLLPGTKAAETDTFTSVQPSPKHVVILINANVVSAAESFSLLAKQSKKVKLIGTPTRGALDYANAFLSGYEYDGHPLILPTYRSLRVPEFPIDNIGIQPDIYLDKTVNDWTAFALDYLEH